MGGTQVTDEPKFTREQLRDEILRFRLLMGERSFWERENRYDALKGLWHVYLRVEDANDDDAAWMEAATMEYTRREALVELEGLTGSRRIV